MARVCCVLCLSHSPYLYAPPEEWNAARLARQHSGAVADDTAVDSPEVSAAKHARCESALATLRNKLRAAKPNLFLIFGDDQLEQFTFDNLPAFSIFLGKQFSGFKISPYIGLPVGTERPRRAKTPEHWTTVKGSPSVAQRILTDLLARGFDMAFSMNLPNPSEGIGHAFMRPLYHLAPDYDVPVIPISINCYYGPQPRGSRCYELGLAIREIVESLPEEISVAVIGSGGLWHTPMLPNARLNPEFDTAILGAVRSGSARAMARAFDERGSALSSAAGPDEVARFTGGTGMLSGYGSGTGEVRNWIAAAAALDGIPGNVIDYVEINASPVGVAFAYWDPGH